MKCFLLVAGFATLVALLALVLLPATPATSDSIELRVDNAQLDPPTHEPMLEAAQPAPTPETVHSNAANEDATVAPARQLESLAPDGQPWSTTFTISPGDPAKRETLSIQWLGNTRQLFYADGQLRSQIAFVDGKREGEARSWHSNGQPWSQDTWVRGRREGDSVVYSRDGVLLARGSYKAGYRNGPWEQWHPNGRRRSSGVYLADPVARTQHKVDRWYAWDPDGSIDEAESGIYAQGELVAR